MAWEIWSNDMFDRDAAPVREAAGEHTKDGMAELWRRHLTEGVDASGIDTLTAFHLRLLPAGLNHYTPRGSQYTAVSLRLREWATSPAHYAILAEFTPEDAYRHAAADPSFPPNPQIVEPPNTVPSPCGQWRVHWWLTSTMADSYSSIDVVAMMVEDRRTGHNAAIPREFEDTSLRPVRFLAPRRVLLYSTEEDAYYEARFDTAKTTKLARPEDAIDEYVPIVLTRIQEGAAAIWGLFGTAAFLAFAGVIGLVLEHRHLAVAPALLVVGFFLFIPLRFATERRRQTIDPTHGYIVDEVHSAIHHATNQYPVTDFARLEYRRRLPVLTGKRDLALIDFSQAERVATRLGLPITGKP